MQNQTITTAQAQRFYDRLGIGHDRGEWYEGRAKRRGLELLDLEMGQDLLNVGVGTGKEHYHICEALGWHGIIVGFDLSPVMLEVATTRTVAPLCRGDVRFLPFAADSFDRIYSSYLLDLVAGDDLPGVLSDMRRVLRPGGRMALVSLTEGVGPLSNTVIGAWKLAYRIDPMLCGGCRPLQLAALVQAAGFTVVEREVVVQSGMPSEVVVAERRN